MQTFFTYLAGFASALAVAGIVWLGFTLANPLAAGNDAEAIASQFHVAVVWDATGCSGAPGCHWTQTPDVIYLEPGRDAAATRQTALHELGHVMQYRLGLPADQCGADRFAEALGGGEPTHCG